MLFSFFSKSLSQEESAQITHGSMERAQGGDPEHKATRISAPAL